MTLVSDIIKSAYRETNIIPLASSPSANQTTEALPLLNTIIAGTLGYESGDPIRDLNYGGDYDQSDLLHEWLPDNVRLVLNLSAAVTLNADPTPYEGQRLAFIDVGGNLATYNVIINGNGRKIEGASSVTLSTNSDARQWMYRGDTGNWVKIEELEAADSMPLPIDYDDYFITSLAMRLASRYGLPMTGESIQTLNRTKSQIRARYSNRRYQAPTDPGLVRIDDLYRNRPADEFETGRLNPWR